MLALLCAMVLGAWADGASTFGGGDGSAKNPYIINTTAHWDQFASDVNGGNTYSDKCFMLGADITVTTMVGAGTTGKNAKPFSGNFDGGGHTLTFNHTATEAEGDIAPFRFVRSATICNLHVAGEINTAYRHAGGLAGRTYGTTLIRNCRVSTVINSSFSGDATHGGIVALKPDWSSAKLTIEGCVYDGKILTTKGSTHCGGFVGYTSYGSLTIKNSIYNPAAPEEGEIAVSSQKTFYRLNEDHPGTITLTNCYYFQTIGNDASQGKRALSIGFGEDVQITVVPTGNATEYSVSGITGYEGNHCVKYNGTVYAGSGEVVPLTFTNNYLGCTVTGYSVAEGNANLNTTNGYVLTMGSANVVFGFTMTGPGYLNLGHEGTQEDPYLIESADVWDYIVSNVNFYDNTEYANANYKLTNDITVTTMMGNENHRFMGHFDGNGHTLTVNYDTDEQYAAPFRYVEGAEISNLRVAGTIRTSEKFAAGFVANAQGTNTITNCRSSVVINSSVDGDGTHGGFVAHNLSGTFTMEGCAFDGSMLGSSTNNCGGFVGWNETNGTSTGVVKFNYCFFAPTTITVAIEKTYARSRSDNAGQVQMEYSSCRTNFGDDQQYNAYSISVGDGVTVTTPQTANKTYTVSGIKIYDVGMMHDGVLYARNNQPMRLTIGFDLNALSEGSTCTGFSTTAGTLSATSDYYTLTMGTADAVINAIINGSGSGWSSSSAGTSESPYIISTSEEWNEFVDKVNGGIYGFNTAYYQLGDNITVTTMVGTETQKFKGHFNGNGKTLTLSYGTAQSPFSEDYCAPFRYIEGADISNLTVSGTIYTQNQFAAGIVGCALNNNTISDCRSSVVINSNVNGDGTHGGLVANCQNNADDETLVTFTRCAFDGKLLGANTDNCGGIVGWTAGNDWAGVTFSNCIFAPSEVSVQNDGSATFSRGRYNNTDRITVNNSYYTQRLGGMQGEKAYITPPTDITTEALTIAGVTVYVKKTLVTDVTATNITPKTATISWTGSNTCSNYKVRYRVKPQNTLYSTSFDDGMPDDWTTFDNDGDSEYKWEYEDGTKKGMAHSGKGCMYSASYINNYGALEPDNWLVSPELTLGGTLKVWLKGQDSDEYREHFAIYLSTAGGSKSDFLNTDGSLKEGVITLVPETETTNEYQEYTANLTAYDGQNQKGYIAIRHFNCYDEFYLVVDDFSLYDENAYGLWISESDASPDGTTIAGLDPSTEYEYQVEYDYVGKTYYTPSATLTTLAENVAPTDLSVTAITANAATISWTGYGDSYNLRYSKGGNAKVTLNVPDDIWQDGSGYQMLLDKDHDTYGSVIPETGGMSGDAAELATKYALFEYKIPENADCNLNTSYMLNGTDGKRSATITIPAGTYDWCITNPTPDDRMWIAANNGNVGGRQDDFVFDAGKHYTFTVTLDDDSGNDRVDMTVEDDGTLATGTVTEVTGITSTSYTLSGLDASTYYTVYVQSVKGDKTSDWSSVSFTTTDATSIGLVDDGDNTAVIDSNNGQQRNVTLAGRTLYKDGSWNTLCLPFPVTLDGSPLKDATVMELDATDDHDGHKTGFEATTGTLYLYFKTASAIEAGKPYIVKWSNTESTELKNPVFTGVTVSTAAATGTTIDTYGHYVVTASNTGLNTVQFIGTYTPVSITKDDKSCLYLGADDTLYYPSANMNINACRAYFHVDLTGSANGVRAFSLNFGDNSEQTGIKNVQHSTFNVQRDSNWYTLDGRRLQGKPTAKGLYICNGMKVTIK